MITKEQIWSALQAVKDPEIPAVSLIEMGIVRDVVVDGTGVTVAITPTFSGCPAMQVMTRDVEQAVLALGIEHVNVEVKLAPAWSSNWISDEGRRKLKEFGLAPPPQYEGNLVLTFFDVIECPRCDSKNTTLKNSFGSTLCRAIWVCNACQEVFEQFKPL